MAIEKVVKDILMSDWDPIGIKNNPNASAEYDGYALRLVGMLYNGVGEGKIADYLNTIVTEELGLPVNDEVSKMVSKKLIALELEGPYRTRTLLKNDFDRRQLNQMKNLIDLLEKKQVGVSKFVSDQWSLVEMLQAIDSQWKKDYFSLVNQIEDIYAASVDQGKKNMDQGDIETIDKVLKRMLILIDNM